MEQGCVGQENMGVLFRRGGSTMSSGRERGGHLEGCYCGQLKVA